MLMIMAGLVHVAYSTLLGSVASENLSFSGALVATSLATVFMVSGRSKATNLFMFLATFPFLMSLWLIKLYFYFF